MTLCRPAGKNDCGPDSRAAVYSFMERDNAIIVAGNPECRLRCIFEDRLRLGAMQSLTFNQLSGEMVADARTGTIKAIIIVREPAVTNC